MESRKIERLSELWALAGRPELSDPAVEGAVIRDDALNAGVQFKQLYEGMVWASEMGEQCPPLYLRNRMVILEALTVLAALYRANPSDDSWMPDLKGREFYKSAMAQIVDEVDEMHREAVAEADSYRMLGSVKRQN